MPEITREVVVKGEVICPRCKKRFEAEVEGDATIEFEMSDLAADYP